MKGGAMPKYIYPMILVLICSVHTEKLKAQTLSLSKTIILTASPFKKSVDPGALKGFITGEVSKPWSTIYPGTELYILQADRGVGKDDLILVCTDNKGMESNKIFPGGNPFSDKVFSALGSLTLKPSSFIKDPEKFTTYRLVGSETIPSLPKIDLLGIHFIQVRDDKAEEFERFVTDKLNPQLSGLLPDMGLFYYKAVDGEDTGTYVTIFAITTVESREQFWPTGGNETEIVKKAFLPLKDLARELRDYLVEGSYLLPESGGAAAYFESLKWTDFVIMK